MLMLRVERNIRNPDEKRRAFLPALSIKLAAITIDSSRTEPTRAASYFGSSETLVR
uniref:Uncharacterized protein n=1 Tax=Anguilla anguilla TaxID=7936 RepID=A0A0E9XV31_ANGAN